MYKRGKVWWTKIRHRGKLIQKSLETSDKKLAKQIEAKIKTEVIEGKYFEKKKGEKFTIKELVEKYLTDYSKPNKKTYYKDFSFTKQIILQLGEICLSDITPKDISNFINNRRESGVGDTMINRELSILSHAFKLAINEWELIDRSPFEKIKIPKGHDAKRVRYLSEGEEKSIFEDSPKWLVQIITVARETGLRRSNLANLSWNQINLPSKTITISDASLMKNGDPLGIPMTDNVYEILSSINRDRQSDYVFINKKKGTPWGAAWISKSFKNVCDKAGIVDFHFHDLRHDFCSKLVQNGVDLYTVAALAGHRKITTTQRYAHLSPEKLRSAVSVFNNGYKSATVEKGK